MKYLLIACVSMLLLACSTKDEQYFRTNPQALFKSIKMCPAKQPSLVSCEQLTNIAAAMNELAYQLQISPQNFGKKILSLQETLAKQQSDLKANPNQADLKETISKNEQSLAERLAVVRWLESPES